MTRLLLALAALLLAASPSEARRQINPMAIYGVWLGTPGARADDCKTDGYRIGLNTGDGKDFLVSIGQQRGGVPPNDADMPTILMKVVPPPAGAPDRIDIFLSGGGSDIGIVIKTGSAMEWVPAGPDKTYAATGLYLIRCAHS